MLTKTDKFVIYIFNVLANMLAFMTVFFDYRPWVKILFIFIAIVVNSATSYFKGLMEK